MSKPDSVPEVTVIRTNNDSLPYRIYVDGKHPIVNYGISTLYMTKFFAKLGAKRLLKKIQQGPPKANVVWSSVKK